MDQRIINLFDEYTHKPLSREEFIGKLIRLTGSAAAAMAVLPLLEVNYANAQTVSSQDDRIITERITYPGDGTEMKAYLARPRGDAKYGAVVVIHENRGLNPHIEDVTRRAALEGFMALAPDALSPLGGTPTDEDKARGMFQQLDAAKTISNFAKAFDYLKTRKDCNGKFGCIGFCWGGAMANNLAVNVPDLKVAVPFYGRQPDAADVPKIKAMLQLHYAAQDERVNAGIAAYEEALKKAGKKYELFMYEGAQHAFHNDTAPTRYNEAAAKLAWSRAMELFNKNLK
ncbi:dienelactone hydrolase family protein [Fulvivirgaceae bacterium PWU4]|uniref:Dienelactone hydrolase family protein n=1 Tax=Chryseosolibacter histidini TaxID=2782349 RepID=A0AAP2DRD7_9BACT|nr:dienelactone hydrolase family protein [Chryseosolibacter histidini]MBT1699842.1 dienelactone hydrolase family protein [Chryseosolibacter histidini]